MSKDSVENTITEFSDEWAVNEYTQPEHTICDNCGNRTRDNDGYCGVCIGVTEERI